MEQVRKAAKAAVKEAKAETNTTKTVMALIQAVVTSAPEDSKIGG